MSQSVETSPQPANLDVPPPPGSGPAAEPPAIAPPPPTEDPFAEFDREQALKYQQLQEAEANSAEQQQQGEQPPADGTTTRDVNITDEDPNAKGDKKDKNNNKKDDKKDDKKDNSKSKNKKDDKKDGKKDPKKDDKKKTDAPQSPKSPAAKPPPSKKDLEKEKKLFEEGRHVAAKVGLRAIKVYRLKSGKVFIITGSHFFLSKPKKSKEPITYQWKQIKSIEAAAKKNTISLVFDVRNGKAKATNEAAPPGFVVSSTKEEFKMIFKKNDYQDALNNVCDVLQRVLTDKELKEIFFSRLNAPQIVRSARSAQSRFRMAIHGKDDLLLPETVQAMYDIIQLGTKNVNLAEYKDASTFYSILFDCIPFIPTLLTVRVPQMKDQPVYENAIKLVKEKSSLRAIELTGRPGKNQLNKFIDAIKKNKDSRIRGLSFSLAGLYAEDLDLIADIIAHGSVRTIGFHDAFKEKAESYFYSSFLNPQVTQNLYCINLDNTHNLDLDRLFPKLSKVRFLSLANCDLDIVTVIKKLPLITNSYLRELNLSGNRISGDQTIDTTDPLPQYLLSLILNNISWPEDAFSLFFYCIFRRITDKLKLSLSNSIMEKNEWLKAFNFLDSADQGGNYNGLSVLVWDHNPLHQKLFNFLKHNPHLSRLQMNGCFQDDVEDTAPIDTLQDYLSNATGLRTLVIRGDREYFFGRNTPRLLEAIKCIPHLEQLDISYSRGGDDSIKPVQELCEQLSSLKINFDGLYPTKFEPLQECMEALVKEMPKKPEELRISYPFYDVKYLMRKGAVTERISRHFEERFFYSPTNQKPPHAPKDTTIQRVKDSEIGTPANLYHLDADEDFPQYITMELIENFKKDNQPLSLTGEPEARTDEDADDVVFRSMVYASRRFSTRLNSGSFRQSSTDDEDDDNIFSKKKEGSNKYESTRLNKVQPFVKPKKELQPSTFDERDVDALPPKHEMTSSSSSSSNEEGAEPKTPKRLPVDNNSSDNRIKDEETPLKPKKSPKAVKRDVNITEDLDTPLFELPNFNIDLKHYEYENWKKFDKNFTLQQMYTDITTVKRSDALSAIKK